MNFIIAGALIVIIICIVSLYEQRKKNKSSFVTIVILFSTINQLIIDIKPDLRNSTLIIIFITFISVTFCVYLIVHIALWLISKKIKR